jgi:hypothetical protein
MIEPHGMKRRSSFGGLRNRNVSASHCAQSESNACADMQSKGAFQPFIEVRRVVVAGLDLPFIEPHNQPVVRQPLRRGVHEYFVLRAIAEENILLENVQLTSPIRTAAKFQQAALLIRLTPDDAVHLVPHCGLNHIHTRAAYHICSRLGWLV